MTGFFDSLVHITGDGSWFGQPHRDASLKSLLEEMERGDVRRACLVGIHGVIDNEIVLDAANCHPDRLVPIAGFHPLAAGSAHECLSSIESLAARGFRGIKLHARLNRYDPLDPLVLSAVRAAGEAKLVVFVDTLFSHIPACGRSAVEVVSTYAEHAPGTIFIMLHAGGPEALGLFEAGRLYANLRLDLSFILMRYAGSSLDLDMRFLCDKLDRRIVVGSDFPEYMPADARSRLLELCEGLDSDRLARIMSGNLDEIFGSSQSRES